MDDDFFSSSPEEQSFLNRLKQRFQAWRINRQIIAEERRSMHEGDRPGGLKQKYEQWKLQRQIVAEERELLKERTKARDWVDPDMVAGSRSQSRADESMGMESDFDRVITSQKGSSGGGLPGDFDGTKESFLQRVKRERELRREILKEQRGLESEFDPSGKSAKQWASESDFGVGKTWQGSDEETGVPKTHHMMWNDARGLLTNYRIPQWILGMVPAVIAVAFFVYPSVNGEEDRAVKTAQKLKTQWPEVIKNQNWDDAILIGNRVLSSGISDVLDNFRYYDSLVGKYNAPEKALNFLSIQEGRQKDLDLGTYKYHFAEKIMKLPNVEPRWINAGLVKLRDSLAGPLSKEEEITARQILASVAYSQGALEAALKFIEPIQSEDSYLATDTLWIRWTIDENPNTETIHSAARGILEKIDGILGKKEKLEDKDILTRVKLLVIMGNEAEARLWVSSLKDLSVAEKRRWSNELDKLTIASEIKKKEPRKDIIWFRLKQLIASEPQNQLWNNMAIKLWADSKNTGNEEAYLWVQDQIRTGKADISFLKQAAMASHVNARWKEAIEVYEKILEKEPNDVPTLNNLSGLLYKFPPRDYKKSLEMCQKAVDLAPENMVVLETKGQILARMGRLEESKVILEQCLPILPREWNLHNTLAQIYDRSGLKDSAAAHRSILASIPKPKDAEQYEKIP